MPILGRHMPLAGRPAEAMRTARHIGCDAVQIFVGNPRGWAMPSERPAETAELIAAIADVGLQPSVIHAAYLINLASNTAITRQRSIDLLTWTMQRGAALGASDIVMHIGSHGGDGLEVGIERLVVGLRAVWEQLDHQHMPRLLLENDVGGGHTIGSHFPAIGAVIAASAPLWGDRIGVCLDTAHLWGAGCDIGTPEAVALVFAAIAPAFALDLVHVVHLNDTAVALGAHRDLHARLGEGIIGRAGLRAFLMDARLANATIILETPILTLPESEQHDWDDEARRLQAARDLIL